MNKLNQQQINQLKIGDKIEIITFHYMIGRLHTTRIIRDIFKNLDGNQTIYVKCFGWDSFKLRANEMISKVCG